MTPTVGITITVLLLALNAFFVAGEFAVTSSRRSRIEPLAEQGVRGSRDALWAIQHVSLLLAVCQLGITVASTSLGAVAEPVIAHLIEAPMVALGLPAASAHVVGFVLALLIVLYLHVVFGEMVPKNLSVSMPDRAILILAPPLVFVGKTVSFIVVAMDHVANWFVRRCGLEPKSEVAATFTVEEVASIVELSQAEGTIHDDLGLLTGSLEFSEASVRDVMVARDQLVTVADTVTPETVEYEVARTGYSRFPVVGDDGELRGYLHIKDVLDARGERRLEPVEHWRIRDLPQVDADDEVEEALREMQRSRTHLAEVVDGGKVTGVLFFEDVLEELIGEVRDALQRNDVTMSTGESES